VNYDRWREAWENFKAEAFSPEMAIWVAAVIVVAIGLGLAYGAGAAWLFWLVTGGSNPHREHPTAVQGIDRMSRPQKIHKPIKGGFNNILASVALGNAAGKKTAEKLARHPIKAKEPPDTKHSK
jgi:hypothetical protein